MAWKDKGSEAENEYHKEFAARLIEQIKKGTAPWQKPWKPGERIAPRNLSTGRDYQGTNTIRLMSVAQDRGYSDSRWGTYQQIKDQGGQVGRGERSSRIQYYMTHRKVAVKDDKGKPVKDDHGEQLYKQEKLSHPRRRFYSVFNAEQADGLKPEPRPESQPTWQAHREAEAVIKASGVSIRHMQSDQAYYSFQTDQVTLPEKSQFPTHDQYYQTALHELGHATGHPDRLNRETLQEGVKAGFGSEAYAREELRAEISAMMTGDKLGTGHDPSRGAAYVDSWVKVLQKDPHEIMKASAEGQKISNYLVSRAQERQQDQGDKTQQSAIPKENWIKRPTRTPVPEKSLMGRSAARLVDSNPVSGQGNPSHPGSTDTRNSPVVRGSGRRAASPSHFAGQRQEGPER